MKKILILAALCSVSPVWALMPYAYVANNGNIQTKTGTVSVINWMTHHVVTTIDVEGRPFSVSAGWDGRYIYTLSANDRTTSTILSVIHTVDNKIIKTKSLAGVGAAGPSAAAATPDGNSIWVTKHDGTILVICAHAYVTLATLKLPGDNPDAVNLIFSPDGKFVYVLGQDSFTGSFVAVFSTANKKVIANIPYGTYAAAMALTPDGNTLYVSDYGGPINVISTKTCAISGVIPLYYAPSMAATRDDRFVWVSSESQDFSSSAIEIVDTATNNVVATSQQSVNAVPFTLGFTPDDQYAYESNDSSSLMVVSTRTNSVVEKIPVGEAPTAVAFLPIRPDLP